MSIEKRLEIAVIANINKENMMADSERKFLDNVVKKSKKEDLKTVRQNKWFQQRDSLRYELQHVDIKIKWVQKFEGAKQQLKIPFRKYGQI